MENPRYNLDVLKENPYLSALQSVFELRDLLDVIYKSALIDEMLKQREETVRNIINTMEKRISAAKMQAHKVEMDIFKILREIEQL